MKNFRSHFKVNSIRKKMLLSSFVLITIMLITSVYTFYNSQQFAKKMNYMFISNRELNELSKSIDTLDSELLSYLTTKSTDSFDKFKKDSEILRNKSDSFNEEISYDNNQIMLTDLKNLIDNYLFAANEAIKARRTGDIGLYNSKYKSAKNISLYIVYYIDKLNLNQFQQNTNKYFYMSEKLTLLKRLNIVIMLDSFLLNVILVLYFTNKISVPIIKLADSAEEISKGNFDTDDISLDCDGEIRAMSITFNNMKNNIKEYIEELQKQAEMESNLMDEKLQNLKMKNLLKNAELKALQSQINPHFLFNTLNAGVQLAMMEDAEKTGLFLENVASLFRYNLRKMNDLISIGDELENLKNYIFILETRFGDLIKFEFNIDKTVINVKMPPMILQPLVENACIHGLGNSENGGIIKIVAKQNNSMAQIVIEDNGIGISKDNIKNILSLKNLEDGVKEKAKDGHSTGIGLENVIQRMRLFSEDDEVIKIESNEGQYTKIIISLKLNVEDDDV